MNQMMTKRLLSLVAAGIVLPLPWPDVAVTHRNHRKQMP